MLKLFGPKLRTAMKLCRKYQIIFLLVLIKISISLSFAEECTTGLASGRVTIDGLPLLWKNRDSGHNNNEVAYFCWGKTRFIGIINADDTTQIWAGVNNYGFAIMNAESRDMAVPEEDTQYDDEGYLMKEALIRSKTVDDFEVMLKETNIGGRKVTSNFGVIDAKGGTSFFETGNHEYFRFDADDSEMCREGFLIRANFAFKGYGGEGYGKKRYQRAFDLFKKGIGLSRLNYSYVISKVTRDIYLSSIRKNSNFTKTNDTVNRYRTVSCAIFQGVKTNEDPRLTTFWCALGEPAVSISIPLWTYSGGVPTVLDSVGYSPLNKVFQELKSYAYSDSSDSKMINTDRLAMIQKELDKTQGIIFRKTERKLRKWRKKFPSQKEVVNFQKKMAQKAFKASVKVRTKIVSEL
mgnify:CR=1 FL=1